MKRTLIIFAGLVCAVSAQAASFDCAKAEAKVEKLICADAGLSKLDEELSVAYKAALKGEKQADSIKQTQKQWIGKRNECLNAECLKKTYQVRIQELSISQPQAGSVSKPQQVASYESPYFDNETNKIKFMQNIVAQHAFKFGSPEHLDNKQFCEQFIKDFTSGKQVEAVAPDVRTSDEKDPRLNKWNRCESRSNVPAGEDVYEFLSEIGGPPYRYYQIELDGNAKNGKEDVIYTEIFKSGEQIAGTGHTGYSWVDIENCAYKGGASVDAQYPLKPLPPNVHRLNMIIKYSGNYLAVELYPRGELYGFHVSPFHKSLGRSCLWFEQEKSSGVK